MKAVVILQTIERSPHGDQARSQNFATVNDAAQKACCLTARHSEGKSESWISRQSG
jgi:hypothetical protein